jgi:hypothetical protein
MNVKSRLQHMAALIEFLAGGGLGIFFHSVLNYQEASYIIFGTGILLSLATYLIREQLARVRTELVTSYDESHQLAFALSRIVDSECQAKARQLVAGIGKNIALLQQGYVPLEETEFFLESAKAADAAHREIRAVDPLTPGWGTRGGIINFYKSNLRALGRGARISRVFVMNREDIRRDEVQALLLSQHNDGIFVRIGFRDELPAGTDPGWAGGCTFNFAVYDRRTVTDIFTVPGVYYGKKTAAPGEVQKYLRLIDLIEHNSHRAAVVDGKITASESTE